LSWDVLSVEPPRTLELDVKVPFGTWNHEIVVVSCGAGSLTTRSGRLRG
jgi:hypothetical protein